LSGVAIFDWTPSFFVGHTGNKKKAGTGRLFFGVRPAGRTYLEVKVLYSPDKGKS
jgi:hypothetical protein